MSGTQAGNVKVALTNKKRYGKDYYKRIGSLGGSTLQTRDRGFARDRDLASTAGKLGGFMSRRKRKDGSWTPPNPKALAKRKAQFNKTYKHLLEVNRKANVR